MKLVKAGGTGSLGRRVADDFARRDHEVVILTRSTRSDIAHRQVEWDGRTVGAWALELQGAVLLNLAGELVDRRPTKRNIELLRRSRVEPTQTLVDAAFGLQRPVSLWLQMSTMAIYGDAALVTADPEHARPDRGSPDADGSCSRSHWAPMRSSPPPRCWVRVHLPGFHQRAR